MRPSIILGLAALLASLPAAAQPGPEDLFTPALYAGLTFGGSGVRDPRLGLRLDSARVPAGTDAPALMQWELRPGGTEFAVAGLRVLASPEVAAASAETGAARSDPSRIVGVSLLGTAALVAVAGWAVAEIFEGFGDDVGEAVTGEMFGSGGDGGGDDPSCTGVAVGDECVGGD